MCNILYRAFSPVDNFLRPWTRIVDAAAAAAAADAADDDDELELLLVLLLFFLFVLLLFGDDDDDDDDDELSAFESFEDTSAIELEAGTYDEIIKINNHNQINK